MPSYYLRYYYAHDEVVAELRRSGTRAAAVQAIEAELLEMYADPALVAKPALLEQRGGAYYSEAAVALIASLLGGPGEAAVHVANVRNGSTLGFLPPDAVIEVPCDVDAAGARPRPVDPLDPLYAGLVAHVSAYEDLALRAAVDGSHDRVVQALLAHPLVGTVRRGPATDRPARRGQSRAPAVGAVSSAGAAVVVAIDGGGSKTDAVVLDLASGEVLASSRGAGSSQHIVGIDAAVGVIDSTVLAALSAAGTEPSQVVHAGCFLSAIDMPDEAATMRDRLGRLAWGARSVAVDNDVFALLRTGTQSPDAAVVVCGTGINGAAVRADGTVARILALGATSGDWGGASGLADEVLWYSARAEDGRGEPTALRAALLSWTGRTSIHDIVLAIHRGELRDVLVVVAGARGLRARRRGRRRGPCSGRASGPRDRPARCVPARPARPRGGRGPRRSRRRDRGLRARRPDGSRAGGPRRAGTPSAARRGHRRPDRGGGPAGAVGGRLSSQLEGVSSNLTA